MAFGARQTLRIGQWTEEAILLVLRCVIGWVWASCYTGDILLIGKYSLLEVLGGIF
jgi:hypothetical protein